MICKGIFSESTLLLHPPPLGFSYIHIEPGYYPNPSALSLASVKDQHGKDRGGAAKLPPPLPPLLFPPLDPPLLI